MDPQHKIGHCNIALLKSWVKTPGEALNPKKKHDLKRLTPTFKDPKITIYLKEAESEPAQWQKMVDSCVKEDLNLEISINKSSVMFFEVGDRIFVAMFGSAARFLVNPSAMEYDFGYTVVNRVIDSNQVNSLEVNSYESNSVKSKMQIANGSSIDRFGLNPFSSRLRTIGGKTKDSKYGKRLYGSRSLIINQSMTLTEVFLVCKQWLEVYQEDASLHETIWSNYGTQVTDEQLMLKLDNKLAEYLQGNDRNDVTIAPPDIYDFTQVEGFKYSNFENEITLEPTLATLFQNIETKSLTKEILSKIFIQEKNAETGHLVNKWTVWDCLEFDVVEDGHTYYLQNGQWHEIPKSAVDKINNLVNEIQQTTTALPHAIKGETEAKYNQRVANSNDLLLMDKELVRGPGYPNGLELCDLMSLESSELIHVKRGTRSSSMSHLIRQGLNSVKMILSERNFKDLAYKQVSSKILKSEFNNFFESQSLTITFAIITSKRGQWSKVLPFFSKLTLVQAHNELKLMRIKMCLAKVDLIEKRTMITKEKVETVAADFL